MQTLCLVCKKCHYLIQVTESYRYNRYIWCGVNVTNLFKKPNQGCISIIYGVQEMSLPNSRNRIMAV